MNNSIAPLSEIMTAAAVLKLLEVSRVTLHRMEKRGQIPVYKFAGKKFFKRSEIIAAITANRVEITPTETTQAA